jgi:trk system potassium uptake protein TrkA
MKIIVVGGGFTGVQLAKRLINEKVDVTLIDNDEDTARHAANRLDCTVIQADGNSLETLEDAGIAKANALVCVTDDDEVNMITCSLVDAVYPNLLKIARVRNFAYYMNTENAQKRHADFFATSHRALYGIDFMVNPDVEAAKAIIRAIETGAISDVVEFGNDEYELTRMTIEKGSKLVGQQILNVRSFVKFPFLIVFVESNGESSLPSGSTYIHEGDCLGVLTLKKNISNFFTLCGTEVESIKKIAFVGAGRIGTLIADRFVSRGKTPLLARLFGHKVKLSSDFAIIDSDEQLTKVAAEKFPNARVLRGDITDEAFLEEENLTDYDLAVCVTHNHELNMVVAAYLESLGVGKTISLVESSAFAEISRKLGIDVPVPIRDVIVDSIMSHLHGKSVTGVHTVSSGNLEIIECTLPASSKVISKTLTTIADPGSFLVMLIKKAGTDVYTIPGGDTSLNANDNLILITQAEKSSNILNKLGAGNKQ